MQNQIQKRQTQRYVYGAGMTKTKRKIEEIETVGMPSGNGGHIMIPKEWIGKVVVARLK
jgi:putative transposon-encoded protein